MTNKSEDNETDKQCSELIEQNILEQILFWKLSLVNVQDYTDENHIFEFKKWTRLLTPGGFLPKLGQQVF